MRTLLHLFVLLLSLQGLLCSEVIVQLAGNSREPDAVRARQQEIIDATTKLLTAINKNEYFTYKEMCDPALSSFEPESLGVLVQDIKFHRFIMENALPPNYHTVIVNPVVHMMGEDAACIAYVRLTQAVASDMSYDVAKSEETRVWHRRDGTWRLVHFHRSASA